MRRGLIILAFSLGLVPVTATFTHTTLPRIHGPTAVPAQFKLVLPERPVQAARALRLWVQREPVPAAAPAESEEPKPRDLASFRPAIPEPSGIPELPEGKPITETRFDFWFSYKFQF